MRERDQEKELRKGARVLAPERKEPRELGLWYLREGAERARALVLAKIIV